MKSFLLSNRLKSLYWRTGAMFLVSFLNIVWEQLMGTGLSGTWVVLGGLVLGEITKALNNFAQGKEA